MKVITPDGLAPLGDYLLETGWQDWRVFEIIYQKRLSVVPDARRGWWIANAATPTPTFAGAIAAVLMGGVFMSNEPGGVVTRCVRDSGVEDPWPYDAELLDRIVAQVGMVRAQGESNEALRDRYRAWYNALQNST